MTMSSVSNQQFADGYTEAAEHMAWLADELQGLQRAAICKWFNVCADWVWLPVCDCLCWGRAQACTHSKLNVEIFRSLKEGEAVAFTFKKFAKDLEAILVTGPDGVFCTGTERWPKGKNMQKRRSKGDHHAKGCKLPLKPKKCHFHQNISIWWPCAP